MNRPSFVYVSYIRSTPEKVWAALTDPQTTRKYWFGMTADSDFKPGSRWALVFADGRVADTGEILEADPPRRLVIRWRNEFKPELKAEGYSRCTMEIEMADYYPDFGGKAVKLTIRHETDGDGGKFIEAVSGGWPKVISNLKSLLETGDVAFKEVAA
ncbi:MAG TPA: SRPBCC family protein [Xanthobacteraceae bacterium]|nr:SRPBCC family protein [Xanthobacteraceae bacterium]